MIWIPNRSHMRPNCVRADFPCSSSLAVGSRTYTFFQSVYSACGTPYFSIQAVTTPTAAQSVSCSPIRHNVGVVHQVHQAASRSPPFQPIVEAAVQLHQFPEVLLPFSPPPVCSRFSLPAPQPLRQHPSTQRLRRDLDPVLLSEVLRRQRRAEAFPHFTRVFLANQPDHFPSELLRSEERR